MVLRDNIFGTPEEDALRRDFTINALAYNIADFSVIDYSTGLSDLQGRLIRGWGGRRPRRDCRPCQPGAWHEVPPGVLQG